MLEISYNIINLCLFSFVAHFLFFIERVSVFKPRKQKNFLLHRPNIPNENKLFGGLFYHCAVTDRAYTQSKRVYMIFSWRPVFACVCVCVCISATRYRFSEAIREHTIRVKWKFSPVANARNTYAYIQTLAICECSFSPLLPTELTCSVHFSVCSNALCKKENNNKTLYWTQAE